MMLVKLIEAKEKKRLGFEKKLTDAMGFGRLALVESLVHEIENEDLTNADVPLLSVAKQWVFDQVSATVRQTMLRITLLVKSN
jgi:hypothetical protein